ncbi:hypothetical protein F8388_011792 [Cannabis sativa]|uniref:GRF-type domain-containing protein n=1 Tax=Cannabis sativa TaxID=3483 RepID=A0A7J6FLR4_CANSA|nr:hypothetical protein F8388_011792 [Cannabis sativa]
MANRGSNESISGSEAAGNLSLMFRVFKPFSPPLTTKTSPPPREDDKILPPTIGRNSDENTHPPISHSSNSVNSGRRYKEEIQWSRPICSCGFESVIRTSRTVDNPNRKFYGCPNYKNKLDRGCNFIMWIEASGRRSRNDLGGLFRRLGEIEANVKQLELKIQGRDEKCLTNVDAQFNSLRNSICVDGKEALIVAVVRE